MSCVFRKLFTGWQHARPVNRAGFRTGPKAMISARDKARVCRRASVALGALLATAAVVAAPAGAAGVFGGLGAVAKYEYGAGEGKINPLEGIFAFAVDHETARYLVADVENGSEVRLQEFNGTKLEAQAIVKPKKRNAKEGVDIYDLQLAVDEKEHAVYLLVDQKRPSYTPSVAQEIVEKEAEEEQALKEWIHAQNELEKAEEKHESETIIKELKKKEEQAFAHFEKVGEEATALEEETVFDAEVPVAAELYGFKTAPSGSQLQKLSTFKTLEAEKLEPYATEVAKEHAVPVLAPSGLAVDPETHEVLISGQQEEGLGEEAAELGEEQEFEKPLTIVQRVHANGELGARYLDAGDCLDDGELFEDDEGNPCAKDEGEEEFPTGLVESSEGRSYLLDAGAPELSANLYEIWEFTTDLESADAATYANAAEAAKAEVKDEGATAPRHVFSLPEAETGSRLLTSRLPTVEYASGETAIAIASLAKGEDQLYSLVNLNSPFGGEQEQSTALLLLRLEEAGAATSVTEEGGGWTAGSGEGHLSLTKCRIPHNAPLSLAAYGEDALVLALSRGFEGAQPEVLEFGPAGEACGEPKASEPHVSRLGAELRSAKAGEAVVISSNVEDGDAVSSKWQFKLEGAAIEETAAAAFTGRTSVLEHTFEHVGKYEIIDTITTDNLAHPRVLAPVRKEFTVTPTLEIKSIKAESSPVAGAPVTFEAAVADQDEPSIKLEYTWKFGDGVEVKGAQSGGSGGVNLSQAHAYASPGAYEVTLSVKDGSGATSSSALKVSVSSSAPPPPTETTTTTPPPTTSSGGSTGSGSSGGGTSSGSGGVLGFVEAKLLSATTVSLHGVLKLKVSCPGSVADCAGSVLVKSAAAVSAGRHEKKAVLTLAKGVFTVTPGGAEVVTLHVSAAALRLLKHLHSLRATATFTTAQGGGPSKTTKRAVMLRLAKAAKHHK